MAQIELFDNTADEAKDPYTTKVSVPQYLPSNKMPEITELFNSQKYSTLVRDIKASTVSEEEKAFLLKAATRHIVFNYSKIADYYAHATPEMQRLMEQSALVIIDLNDAIANGYVQFSRKIQKIMSETGESASDEE